MSRVPAEVIERLKETVSVQRLAEARGVALKRHGADLVGRCPFHDDKTPSLVITPAKNLWHCLGACQCGGTVIDWVMKAEGVSFRHAVELLQSDYSPSITDSAAPAQPVKRSTVKKLAAPIERATEDARLLQQVIEYYHQTLLQSPEAMAYLEKRGIASLEAVHTFKLGHANRTLGYRLPDANRVEGAVLRTQLQKVGLLRPSGHEHFNGSLVIPVINEHGEVTEVYGRKLLDNLRAGTPKHLYLPGPHRGVFNSAALGASQEIILCESLIDALTFWCAGYRNVTASYGVEGFTADHLAFFKHCAAQQSAQRVLIAYDRDEAGDRAAEKLSKQLLAEGLDCYRIQFPKGMDANEYALKVGPAQKSLGVVIRSAQWLGKGAAPPLMTSAVEPTLVVNTARDGVADVMTASVPDAVPLVAEVAAQETTPPEAVLPAHVVPEPPQPMPATAVKALGEVREHVITFGERRYRVRGLERNLSYEVLKVNVLVCAAHRTGEEAVPGAAPVLDAVHVDTFDVYHARQRAAFVKQASVELGLSEDILKADLGKLLLALEAEQEKLIAAAQQPQTPAARKIDDSERAAALALLRDPQLIACIAADFARAGIVGERSNALVGYLAAVSRKLDKPLALLIQSTSAAGKSSLMDAVLKFVPEEDRVVYSAMTGQSLFYMGEMDLKHKILAIAEEEGAHRASYALKLLQSDGELTIASTSKDPNTGKLTTDQYRVEGPVMIFSTTTAADLDEELQNRCLVLGVDESREQTQAIHRAQRERRTLAGLHLKAERAQLLTLHQNAQRLIEPLAVMNPYADQLTFIDDRTRTRRDHEKYLTMIDVIALLHQHQRVLHTAPGGLRYIEVTLEDIAVANTLAHDVLGRSLDELPPQTRRLLSLMGDMVSAQCAAQQVSRTQYRFSRREVREHTHWGDTQLKIHLARLVELEYVLVHRGGRGQSFEYELLYDGPADGTDHHLNGLIDIDTLRAQHRYDAQRSGLNEAQSGVGRPSVGVSSGDGRRAESHLTVEKPSVAIELPRATLKPHGTRSHGRDASYVPESSLAAAR